jgi:hypothetical protein
MSSTVSARYFQETEILVLTSLAFGSGHLFTRMGEGQWWCGTWAVKIGHEEIEKKWQAMGKGREPIPCLLFMNRFAWRYSGQDDPCYHWIGRELETKHGIHIPSEVVHVSWLNRSVTEDLYPWRLRVTATGPQCFSNT